MTVSEAAWSWCWYFKDRPTDGTLRLFSPKPDFRDSVLSILREVDELYETGHIKMADSMDCSQTGKHAFIKSARRRILQWSPILEIRLQLHGSYPVIRAVVSRKFFHIDLRNIETVDRPGIVKRTTEILSVEPKLIDRNVMWWCIDGARINEISQYKKGE